MILSDSLFAKSSHSLRTDIDHVLGGGDDGDDVDYDPLHAKSSHSLTEDWAPMSFNQSAYNIHKDLKVVDAEVTLDIHLIGSA